jgi:hypothetical protein
MERLHSLNYYMHLLSEGCENCSAYNEIGGCGTWASHCHVREELEEAENFMEDNHLTFEDFIALIGYWECVESVDYWNNVIAPRLEEEEDFEAADYDYWLECSKDAMWISNNC